MNKGATRFIRLTFALILASVAFAGDELFLNRLMPGYTEKLNDDLGRQYAAAAGLNTAVEPPVLVVPGIMGSLSSCLFVDPESGKACPAHQEFALSGNIDQIDLTPQWVLDPTSVPSQKSPTYDSLVQALQNAGLQVFPAPYDWRRKNQVTAATTLANVIDTARQETGSDKVDIVAHSMGGLVSRCYIEQLNNSDVRKFVMLGTPNRGSANAYYIWEGGNFSVYDFETEFFFVNPLIEDMKNGYGCQNMSDYQFIEQKIPAARQLLPVDPYLLLKNIITGQYKRVSIESMHWQNDLIPGLNYSTLISNLSLNNIIIFAGTNPDKNNTIKKIFARRFFKSPPWVDGKPVSRILGDGDGTVLLENAQLGDIAVVVKNTDHVDLPDTCRNDVVQFITGQSQVSKTENQESTEKPTQTSPKSLLFIGTSDRVHMGIRTAENLKLGNFSKGQGKIAEPANYYYRGTARETAALGLYDPSPGEYILNIGTDEQSEDYKLYISYSDKYGKRKKEIKGTISNGTTRSYTIRINNNLEVNEP